MSTYPVEEDFSVLLSEDFDVGDEVGTFYYLSREGNSFFLKICEIKNNNILDICLTPFEDYKFSGERELSI